MDRICLCGASTGAIIAATLVGGSCALITLPLLTMIKTPQETEDKIFRHLAVLSLTAGVVGATVGAIATKTAKCIRQKFEH